MTITSGSSAHSGVSEAKDGPVDQQAAVKLLRRGVAVPPRAPLDIERFLNAPVVRLSEGASASEIIVAERRARG